MSLYCFKCKRIVEPLVGCCPFCGTSFSGMPESQKEQIIEEIEKKKEKRAAEEHQVAINTLLCIALIVALVFGLLFIPGVILASTHKEIFTPNGVRSLGTYTKPDKEDRTGSISDLYPELLTYDNYSVYIPDLSDDHSQAVV